MLRTNDNAQLCRIYFIVLHSLPKLTPPYAAVYRPTALYTALYFAIPRHMRLCTALYAVLHRHIPPYADIPVLHRPICRPTLPNAALRRSTQAYIYVAISSPMQLYIDQYVAIPCPMRLSTALNAVLSLPYTALNAALPRHMRPFTALHRPMRAVRYVLCRAVCPRPMSLYTATHAALRRSTPLYTALHRYTPPYAANTALHYMLHFPTPKCSTIFAAMTVCRDHTLRKILGTN